MVAEVTNKVDDSRPPKFITALRPQFVPQGEATILSVEVDSVPESVFTWKQHGVVIQVDYQLQIQGSVVKMIQLICRAHRSWKFRAKPIALHS